MSAPSNPTAVIEVDLAEVYLNTARSVSAKLMRQVDKTPLAHTTDQMKVEWGLATSLSLTSITVLYSYLAVEAFANGNLYLLWQRAHSIYKAGRLETAPDGPPTALREFCESFGPYSDFKAVCDKEKKMRDLHHRLKTLCRVLKLPPLHDAQPRLWQEFLKLTQAHRHFLVHPYPEIDFFHDNATAMLLKTGMSQYPRTAAEIIRHFYTHGTNEPPTWLDANELYEFTGILSLTRTPSK